jgi:hypothetical protein
MHVTMTSGAGHGAFVAHIAQVLSLAALSFGYAQPDDPASDGSETAPADAAGNGTVPGGSANSVSSGDKNVPSHTGGTVLVSAATAGLTVCYVGGATVSGDDRSTLIDTGGTAFAISGTANLIIGSGGTATDNGGGGIAFTSTSGATLVSGGTGSLTVGGTGFIVGGRDRFSRRSSTRKHIQPTGRGIHNRAAARPKTIVGNGRRVLCDAHFGTQGDSYDQNSRYSNGGIRSLTASGHRFIGVPQRWFLKTINIGAIVHVRLPDTWPFNMYIIHMIKLSFIFHLNE